MQVYTINLPNDEVEPPEITGGMDVDETDILHDRGTAETISSPANELELTFHFDGPNSERNALELQELLNQPNTAPLPISFAPESTVDGFYTISSTRRSIRSLTDRGETHETVTASATKVGTRSSHERAIYTRTTQPDPGNVFGNRTTALIAVPASASRVKWRNRAFTEESTAAVVRTVQTRFGQYDLYDARNAPSSYRSDAVLTYTPDSYDVIGDGDTLVWDTHGVESKVDSDGSYNWTRVYDPGHDPNNGSELVVENGLIRLWLDPVDGLVAERWRPTADRSATNGRYADSTGAGGMIYSATDGRGGTYYPQGDGPWDTIDEPLQSQPWTLAEVDITRIGAAAVEAQLVFEEGTAEYTLDMRLERGRRTPQWFVPETVSAPVPDGLQTLLDPIADESVYKTGAELGLVARRDLRK